jgi:hypothetical protein
MQKAFAAAESGAEGGAPPAPSLDLALKPGETLSLNLTAKVPLHAGHAELLKHCVMLKEAPCQRP